MKRRLSIFAPSDDRIIFWLSWIFVVSQFPQRLLDEYVINYHISREMFMRFYLVFAVLGGFVLWKLFQKQRMVAIRNSVIGLQGFYIFHLFLFAVWLGLFLLLKFLFREVLPIWISSVCGIALFYIATFLGGCWIGYKNDRLTCLWCSVGVIFLYFGITLGLASFNAGDSPFVVLSIITSILGGQVGKTFLAVQTQPHTQPADPVT